MAGSIVHIKTDFTTLLAKAPLLMEFSMFSGNRYDAMDAEWDYGDVSELILDRDWTSLSFRECGVTWSEINAVADRTGSLSLDHVEGGMTQVIEDMSKSWCKLSTLNLYYSNLISDEIDDLLIGIDNNGTMQDDATIDVSGEDNMYPIFSHEAKENLTIRGLTVLTNTAP